MTTTAHSMRRIWATVPRRSPRPVRDVVPGTVAHADRRVHALHRAVRTPKIVVGLVNDPASRHALRWAYRAACQSNMSLVIVTAYQPSNPVLTINGYAYFDEGTCRHAAENMQRTLLHADLGVDCASEMIASVVIEGRPTDVLVTAAQDADLLVVGRRASRIRRMLTGSVSGGCANRASCPIVIIRATHDRRSLPELLVPVREKEVTWTSAPPRS